MINLQTSSGIYTDGLYWSVWFRSPLTRLASPLPAVPSWLLLLHLFLSTSKCMVLIKHVTNRKADKEKYKSLDLHFILGF